jgi:alpha-1,3-fucosyltransferase
MSLRKRGGDGSPDDLTTRRHGDRLSWGHLMHGVKAKSRCFGRIRSLVPCRLLVILSVLLGVCFMYVRTNSVLWVDPVRPDSTVTSETFTTIAPDAPLKHILYFTPYWDGKDYHFGTGQEPFLQANCPVNRCFATIDRVHLPTLADFDAFLVHAHYDHIRVSEFRNISTWRQPHHRFVLLAMESPDYGSPRIPARPFELDYREGTVDPFDDFFHWTMSYRWDSDLPRPYGWFQDRQSTEFYPSLPKSWKPYDEAEFLRWLPRQPPAFRQLARRPQKVAWVVSNCNAASGRDDYVRELQKYIPVDVFGRCSGTPCDQPYNSIQVDNCTVRVREDYKFYLGFENTFCNDYATEKFFGRVGNNLVVTMGQANYSRLAPPHSHLDVRDFPSPRALAERLRYLDQNDTAYLSYFWWHAHYRVYPAHLAQKPREEHFSRSMCKLCERLHAPEAERAAPTYSDLQTWWTEPSECGKQQRAVTASWKFDP